MDWSACQAEPACQPGRATNRKLQMHEVIATITPETPTERDTRLNEAIDQAMSTAARARSGGVLVTRHAPAHFTVAVTNQVPYGQVEELDAT